MRNQRGKQCDWSKGFRIILSKKQFDGIENNDNQLIANTNTEDNKKTTHQDQKQQIIVPKIQTVRRITQVKHFAGVPLQYIRILKDYNLPKLMSYELREVDHIFINAHEGRFKIANANCLTSQFVQKAFIQMQLKAGRDPVIPRNKSWMNQFIERQYKQIAKLVNYEEFSELIYNYWRNRRQELKFPLLRLHWRPSPEQFNHLLAFKFRQKEKRNLRKTNRIADDQISVQLFDEFDNILHVCERIKMREQLKLKNIKLQILAFHNESQQVNIKKDNFILNIGKQITKEDLVTKDREKIRKFQSELEQLRKKRQSYQQEEDIEPENQILDQRTTTINFISTVCSYAEQFGISYDTFNQTQTQIQTQTQNQTQDKNQIKNFSSPLKNISTTMPLEDPVPIDHSDILNLQLSTYNGFLLRKPHASTENSFMNSSQNFINYKRSNVSQYFFGNDDDGDYKDIRKNISLSFKKFIQISRANE